MEKNQTNSHAQPVPSVRQGPSLAELKARNVLSTMKEHGRVRDLKTREKLARNLGRILADRKKQLNLSDLVVSAGISGNNDPNRLGRFRILPGREANRSSIERLNQDPISYYRITKEIARITNENPLELLLDLVIGTKFEGEELEGLSIEPFEQLLALIQKKIDVLEVKYDLSVYFSSLKEHKVLPVWGSGPFCYGRRTAHHAYERSSCIDWEPSKEFDHDFRYQTMPCVPLCRVGSFPGFSGISGDGAVVNYVSADQTFREDWQVYYRLFLAIGMFEHETFELLDDNNDTQNDASRGKFKTISDSAPRPYLIAVQEFHEVGRFGILLGNRQPFVPLTGGVDYDQQPFYFYDRNTGIEVNDFEEHSLLHPDDGFREFHKDEWKEKFGCGHLFSLERVLPLNLNLLREVFGKSPSHSLGEDALKLSTRRLTLSPRNSIAAYLEENLLTPPEDGAKAGRKTIKTVLDQLEENAEEMTSSFLNWFHNERETLNQRHISMLEQFEEELRAAGQDEHSRSIKYVNSLAEDE
jgi:hypothetical protein